MKALPSRHSLFWKLLVPTLGACLLIVWLSWSWGRAMEVRGYRFPDATRQALRAQAALVEGAWRVAGAAGVERALDELRRTEGVWAVALDPLYRSLASTPLTAADAARLRGMRSLDWARSARQRGPVVLEVPFPGDPTIGRLILELPERLAPSPLNVGPRLLSHGLLPLIATLLLCAPSSIGN